MTQLRMNGSKVLEVDLHGDSIKALTGSMVAYDGKVDFKKASFGGEGLGKAFKRKLTGESLDLMECTGQGRVWFAAQAHEIELIPLQGDTLFVESSSLLALDGQLQTAVKFTGVQGAMSGGNGVFTTAVSGNGTVAVVSDGPAIALEVSAQFPLVVDPQAYIAHRGQLQQSFVTSVSWKDLVGEGTGEAFSLRFDGTGVVYIQPAER